MITFELVNDKGCLMKTVKTTSFKKARELFNQEFGGKYRIYWYQENFGPCYQNVIFKYREEDKI